MLGLRRAIEAVTLKTMGRVRGSRETRADFLTKISTSDWPVTTIQALHLAEATSWINSADPWSFCREPVVSSLMMLSRSSNFRIED